ncbi:putative amino acid transporter [Aspergillus affinis]|uniref:putative amino acid transporter n=1 Tax=Aspergillus affinis TaxID=1070780 RepID=UPI0022FED95A|nr:putative amino acid transporter [Aspergillus affinis]KAI9038225.1 putative amino acid transporter [Aspergillus affinis]
MSVRELESAETLYEQTSTSQDVGDDEKKERTDAPSPTDDPFGNEEHAEVKYRVMKWWQSGMLMTAQNVSLGILSLPSAVATLGIVPAIIILVVMSGVAWYTGILIGKVKLRYPQVHSMSDAGGIFLGRFAREFLSVGQLIFLIFLMASHVLTFSVLMNELTDHGACTIGFSVVGLAVSFIGSIPRRMKRVYWISVISFASILTATVFTMIAIGVQNPVSHRLQIATSHGFAKQFLAVTNILFAYIAHVAFFGFISEMQNPRDYPKSLAMLQILDTSMYVVTAVVIYCYAGPDVMSPALSSAGPVMKKVAWGLAIPTVVFSGVIHGHVASKYVYVRMLRGSSQMHNRSFRSVGAWLGIGFVVWVIAWVVAESIPVFNDMLGLISSLFGSWFSYGLPAIFGLGMNKGQLFSSPRRSCVTIIQLTVVGMACAICGLGLYVTGKSIHETSQSSSWTCANNGS